MKGGTAIEGLAELQRNLQNANSAVELAIMDGLTAGGLLIEGHAKRLIQQVSSGKAVKRYRGKGTKPKDHTASRPGDAPNTDTGALVRSIVTEPVPAQGAVYVGSAIEYAPHLEFGTKDGTLQPRPFIGPAYQAKRQEVMQLVADKVKGALRGLAK